MVEQTPSSVGQEYLTTLDVTFSDLKGNITTDRIEDFTVQEVTMSESLLTPSTQTSFKVHNFLHNVPKKDLDIFKGATVNIVVDRPILQDLGFPVTRLETSQTIYRLGGRSATNPRTIDNRKMHNKAVEQLTFHACDPTLLKNMESLVSKSWKCTPPSVVVSEVLGNCVGARSVVVDAADPARDYIAENIQPFQVIAQQANAALHEGNDPSFVHFMTYENGGTHYFRSLKRMAEQTPVLEALTYSTVGNSYNTRNGIMHYVFPCDFDLLTDLANGIGSNGDIVAALAMVNPANKMFSLLNNAFPGGCGVGAGFLKSARTNFGTEIFENSCPDFAAFFMQKRQARMHLLDPDKVALRMTVPWNPIWHVGRVVEIHLINERDPNVKNYGSGKYLISSLIHTIRNGGYSTTTLDCVADTVSRGIV